MSYDAVQMPSATSSAVVAVGAVAIFVGCVLPIIFQKRLTLQSEHKSYPAFLPSNFVRRHSLVPLHRLRSNRPASRQHSLLSASNRARQIQSKHDVRDCVSLSLGFKRSYRDVCHWRTPAARRRGGRLRNLSANTSIPLSPERKAPLFSRHEYRLCYQSLTLGHCERTMEQTERIEEQGELLRSSAWAGDHHSNSSCRIAGATASAIGCQNSICRLARRRNQRATRVRMCEPLLCLPADSLGSLAQQHGRSFEVCQRGCLNV